MSDACVIDASALVLALIGKGDDADVLRGRLTQMSRHAPHLIDAEVGNVLRRHEQRGQISSDEALAALDAGRVLVEHRFPHTGRLASLAWTLRANVSFHNALYVALATQLGVPLLSADVNLSRAPNLGCAVELV